MDIYIYVHKYNLCIYNVFFEGLAYIRDRLIYVLIR